MATKLDKSIKRELELDGTLYTILIAPEGLKITEKGKRKGQYSIRINDQWRVCFEWPDKSPGPTHVEIVDYH